MPIERILEAENVAESSSGAQQQQDDLRTHRGLAGDVGNHVTKQKMLSQLVAWAKHIPHFDELKKDDQVRIDWYYFNYISDHVVLVEYIRLGTYRYALSLTS